MNEPDPVLEREDLSRCRTHDPAGFNYSLWVQILPGGKAYNVASHPHTTPLLESLQKHWKYAHRYCFSHGPYDPSGDWLPCPTP